MSDQSIATIFYIRDEVDRAERLERALANGIKDPRLLERCLEDEYDVIRAEALDYIISSDIDIDASVISRMAEHEKSYIVTGRILLYSTIKGYKGSASVSRMKIDRSSKYGQVWLFATDYLVHRDIVSFSCLLSMLSDDDYSVTQTSLDLLYGFSEGIHRSMLFLVVKSLMQTDVAISKSRIKRISKALAREAFPTGDLNSIRRGLCVSREVMSRLLG